MGWPGRRRPSGATPRCLIAISLNLPQEIPVKNQFNTFEPYRVGFAPGSHRDFTVTPTAGTMNRRDSEPVNVLVRLLLVYSTNRPKASTHPIISAQQRARRQAALSASESESPHARCATIRRSTARRSSPRSSSRPRTSRLCGTSSAPRDLAVTAPLYYVDLGSSATWTEPHRLHVDGFDPARRRRRLHPR